MPTKKREGEGGGRWEERERGGGGGGGRKSKKEPKRKKERNKTRLQPDKSRDCRIFRQGCYSYLMVQSERRYWSTNREIVKAFTSMVGARAYHPPLNVCKLRRFGELYQSTWVFNKLLDFKAFFTAVLRDIC